jgi:hypothetical protein
MSLWLINVSHKSYGVQDKQKRIGHTVINFLKLISQIWESSKQELPLSIFGII